MCLSTQPKRGLITGPASGSLVWISAVSGLTFSGSISGLPFSVVVGFYLLLHGASSEGFIVADIKISRFVTQHHLKKDGQSCRTIGPKLLAALLRWCFLVLTGF